MKSGFANSSPARAKPASPRRIASPTRRTDPKKANRGNRTIHVFVPAVQKIVPTNLFRAEHRVLQRLGGGEAKPGARRNLDLLTGRRIAAHPCLGLALAENPEAGQPQRSFLLQFS